MIGVDREMTERKRAKGSLGKSENSYHTLFQQVPYAMYEIDYRNRRFVRVNDVVCTYTGYSKEELMQMDPFELYTEHSMNIFQERMKLLREGKKIPIQQIVILIDRTKIK